MDVANWLCQRRAVLRQRSRSSERDRSTAGIRLRIPLLDHPLRYIRRSRAKVAHKVLLDQVLHFLRGLIIHATHFVRLEKPHECSPGRVLRRVVVRDARRAEVTHRLSGQVGITPPRLVVDGDGLSDRAHEETLGKLVAPCREGRLVMDSCGKWRCHGDYDALGYHCWMVVR